MFLKSVQQRRIEFLALVHIVISDYQYKFEVFMDLRDEVLGAYCNSAYFFALNLGIVLVQQIIETLIYVIESKEYTTSALFNAVDYLEHNIKGSCLRNILFEVRPIKNSELSSLFSS